MTYQEDLKAHTQCGKCSSSKRMNWGSRWGGASQLALVCRKWGRSSRKQIRPAGRLGKKPTHTEGVGGRVRSGNWGTHLSGIGSGEISPQLLAERGEARQHW